MKAAVLVEPGALQIRDVPQPEPQEGEVLIDVTLAGICGSDYSLYHGKFDVPLPVIPGHEAIGRIAAIGTGGTDLRVGQRVTIQPNFSCQTCPVCEGGHQNICPSKVRLGVDTNGVFAEYVTAPSSYVWPLPDELDDEVAVLTEPLAVATHGVNLIPPRKGGRVLVLGAGVIGLLTLQLAQSMGAEVTACDLAEQRLSVARDLGAAQALNARDSLQDVHNFFDVIYETSGAPSALAQAIHLAAPGGKIVLYGLPGQEHPIPTPLIVRKELQIIGSMIYTDEFPQAINLLKSGQIQSKPLISCRMPLSDLEKGLKDFSAPNRLKMLVEI